MRREDVIVRSDAAEERREDVLEALWTDDAALRIEDASLLTDEAALLADAALLTEMTDDRDEATEDAEVRLEDEETAERCEEAEERRDSFKDVLSGAMGVEAELRLEAIELRLEPAIEDAEDAEDAPEALEDAEATEAADDLLELDFEDTVVAFEERRLRGSLMQTNLA